MRERLRHFWMVRRFHKPRAKFCFWSVLWKMLTTLILLKNHLYRIANLKPTARMPLDPPALGREGARSIVGGMPFDTGYIWITLRLSSAKSNKRSSRSFVLIFGVTFNLSGFWRNWRHNVLRC